jgi:hypothetical protein
MAKVSTKDWQNLPIEKWNATTYRELMKHLSEQCFGLPYTAYNVKAENGMITNLRKEIGNEGVKRFIIECFKIYKPTPQYPALNFGFMYSFMRGDVIPRVLAEMQREKQVQERKQQSQVSEDDFNDWI